MKKHLSLLLLIGSGLIAAGQAPTITKLDFYKAGTTLTDHVDSILVHLGPEGINQVWDYSHLKSAYLSTQEFISPKGTPQASRYPHSTSASRYMSDTVFRYYTANTNGFYYDNVTQYFGILSPDYGQADFIFDTPFVPSWKILQFPLSYKSSWHSSTVAEQTMEGRPPFDSVQKRISYSHSSYCDGWGSLRTPQGFFPKTLRVRSYVSYEDITSYFDGTFPPSTFIDTVYDWYATGIGYSLLHLQKWVHPDGYYATYYEGGLSQTGLSNDLHSKKSLLLYPNPSKGDFFVEGSEKVTQVVHSSGRSVAFEATSYQNGFHVHLQDVGPGVYAVQVLQNGQFAMLKLVLNE